MELENNNISDLVYLGRRIDKSLKYIKENEPDFEPNFIESVNNTFIRIILEHLDQEEEDYLFEIIDEMLDYLEDSYNTVFEQK
jgi:uncharacterized protein (UPF0305 family)